MEKKNPPAEVQLLIAHLVWYLYSRHMNCTAVLAARLFKQRGRILSMMRFAAVPPGQAQWVFYMLVEVWVCHLQVFGRA